MRSINPMPICFNLRASSVIGGCNYIPSLRFNNSFIPMKIEILLPRNRKNDYFFSKNCICWCLHFPDCASYVLPLLNIYFFKRLQIMGFNASESSTRTIDLPTILYSYSSAGYASTDESANSDALSNPVLPDESHQVISS